MTGPDRPQDDGTGSAAGQPGAGGPAASGWDAPGGAPAGFPAPPAAGSGGWYGAPTAYGAPAGYGPPSAYGAPPSFGAPTGYGPPSAYGAPPSFGVGGMPALATWGSRVGASLIDSLILIAIIVVAVVAGVLLGTVSEALSVLLLGVGYVAAFGFYLWQLSVQGVTGQTIGKKQLGIRLLCERDGRPVGAGLSIGRAFLHVVDSIPCYVGYLWPLWDAKKQTFADKILSTVVVRG